MPPIVVTSRSANDGVSRAERGHRMIIERLVSRLTVEGLRVTGAFHPEPADGAPAGTGSLCLIGADGDRLWPVFAASPEIADGAADPLDRWSRRVLGQVAAELDAKALFPFDGPPYPPFPAWGGRAEGARPSPVGMLASGGRGLWISWRGALAFRDRLKIDANARMIDPCLDCPAPCLTACPVGALGPGRYDVPACVAHASAAEGRACREAGCRVRHACPAGAGSAPPTTQLAFHMAAFLEAHRPAPTAGKD